MKAEYRKIRLKQLALALASFRRASTVARPSRGWLRAVREALAISLEDVGRATHAAKQSILAFERAEANDRITLRNLRRVAEAMGCQLVYAIVPKSGTIQELAEREVRNKTTKRVLSVEHTMALEGQAPGGVEELIDEETKRKTRRS
jgi:predicted DNA-binding mobile mystery protein A